MPSRIFGTSGKEIFTANVRLAESAIGEISRTLPLTPSPVAQNFIVTRCPICTAEILFSGILTTTSKSFVCTSVKTVCPAATTCPISALTFEIIPSASAVKRPRVRAASLFAAAALAAANAALAANAARSFENDETLAERTLKCDPDNWRALRTLGRTLAAREGRMDEGIDMLKRSLALRRSQLTADSLAYLLACRGADGDFDEVRRMAKAVRKRPDLDRSGMMHDALGVVEMREGDWDLAAKDFSASLVAPERTYTNIHTMLNLGLSLANAGKRADAVLILVKLRGVADRQVRDRALEALDVIKSRRPCRFEWR